MLQNRTAVFYAILAYGVAVPSILTLFSMGYFKNTTVWGALWPPPNFVVSSSIMIKFGVLIEFDKFSPI